MRCSDKNVARTRLLVLPAWLVRYGMIIGDHGPKQMHTYTHVQLFWWPKKIQETAVYIRRWISGMRRQAVRYYCTGTVKTGWQLASLPFLVFFFVFQSRLLSPILLLTSYIHTLVHTYMHACQILSLVVSSSSSSYASPCSFQLSSSLRINQPTDWLIA